MSAMSNTDYRDSEPFSALLTCPAKQMRETWPFDWRPVIGDVVEIGHEYFTVTRVSFDVDQLRVLIYITPGSSL